MHNRVVLIVSIVSCLHVRSYRCGEKKNWREIGKSQGWRSGVEVEGSGVGVGGLRVGVGERKGKVKGRRRGAKGRRRGAKERGKEPEKGGEEPEKKGEIEGKAVLSSWD